MGERRFYLAVNDGVPFNVSDSEFKRRFRLAVEKWRCDQPWDKVVDILLHGDAEKCEDRLAFVNECLEEVDPGGKQALAEARRLYDEKPTLRPTRAEWEAWIFDMPFNPTQIREWLFKMPIIPKD